LIVELSITIAKRKVETSLKTHCVILHIRSGFIRDDLRDSAILCLQIYRDKNAHKWCLESDLSAPQAHFDFKIIIKLAIKSHF